MQRSVRLQRIELHKLEFPEMSSFVQHMFNLHSAVHSALQSLSPSSSASGNDTRRPCVTLDLRRTSQTDGTSDSPQPMALFTWHNTQTLAFSPISSPAATPRSWTCLCWLNGGPYSWSTSTPTHAHTHTCTSACVYFLFCFAVCQGNWCFILMGTLIHISDPAFSDGPHCK